MPTENTITTSLVGSHFRPPAKALLACLPAGHPLVLRPEPTNEYDENAVGVFLLSSTIPTGEDIERELEIQLADQGFDLQSVRAEPEWQLGYLPKAAKNNLKLQEWNIEVQRAIHVVAVSDTDATLPILSIPCMLTFDAAGKPAVIIPWPPLPEPLPETLPQAGEPTPT